MWSQSCLVQLHFSCLENWAYRGLLWKTPSCCCWLSWQPIVLLLAENSNLDFVPVITVQITWAHFGTCLIADVQSVFANASSHFWLSLYSFAVSKGPCSLGPRIPISNSCYCHFDLPLNRIAILVTEAAIESIIIGTLSWTCFNQQEWDIQAVIKVLW